MTLDARESSRKRVSEPDPTVDGLIHDWYTGWVSVPSCPSLRPSLYLLRDVATCVSGMSILSRPEYAHGFLNGRRCCAQACRIDE
jgi:hypothetical protein